MAGMEATINGVDLDTRRSLLPDTVPEDEIPVPNRIHRAQDISSLADTSSSSPSDLVALLKVVYPFAEDRDLAKYLQPDYPVVTCGYRIKVMQGGRIPINKIGSNLSYHIGSVVDSYLPEGLKSRNEELTAFNTSYHTNTKGKLSDDFNPAMISGKALILYAAEYFYRQTNPVMHRMGKDILLKTPEHVLEKIFGLTHSQIADGN